MCKRISVGWSIFTQFKNANLIFPTQQVDVNTIIEDAIKDMNVKRVIIFGSSTTSACNPWSDIDVYYELYENKDIPSTLTIRSIDSWSNFNVNEELYSSIMKGVVVYERDIT